MHRRPDARHGNAIARDCIRRVVSLRRKRTCKEDANATMPLSENDRFASRQTRSGRGKKDLVFPAISRARFFAVRYFLP